MSDEFDFEEVPYNPATMATSSLGITKAIWYKRPWFLITVGLVLIVAISIITDLPRPLTKAQDASSQNASIRQINTDVKPCAFAVKQSFQFYNDFVKGVLTPSEFTRATAYLSDDRTACSFASGPITDLTNNIQVLDTTAGKHIDRLLSDSEKWMTDYALDAINSIQFLFKQPGAIKQIVHLTSLQARLSVERTVAISDISKAQQILGIKLKTSVLPVLPHLIGT